MAGAEMPLFVSTLITEYQLVICGFECTAPKIWVLIFEGNFLKKDIDFLV